LFIHFILTHATWPIKHKQTEQHTHRIDTQSYLYARNVEQTDVEDADLGKAAEAFPLLANVLFVANNDDVFELVLVEVAGSERHDEVAKTDQRRVGIGKQTDDHVIAEYRHRRLLAGLHGQYITIISHCSQCKCRISPILN